MSTTKQDGMEAALTVQKFAKSVREVTKDGTKETRQLVLKGEFHIFVEGQRHPTTLPVKLEFKDDPSTVQLVQTALNVEDTGEQCLLAVYSNRQKRLDKYLDSLDKHKRQQQLDYDSAHPPDEQEEEEEDEEE